MRARRPGSPPAPTPTLAGARSVIALLVLAFVLSGAAGLIYETIWSRYLSLLVGHSAYAQVIVLVIFMGGMAAGALAAAQRSERLRDPLLLYAWVEAAIGLIGLAFHPIYVALTDLAYTRWFPALDGPASVTVVKWGLSALLILPQSVLLGATFPLMSAGVVRRVPHAPGRVLASLYFANSLGAAVGALVSGFWLVAAVGLPGTVAAAALLNLAVAAGVIALRHRRPATASKGTAPGEEAWRPRGSVPGGTPGDLARVLLGVSFGTAVASFIYEIAWVRMLSLVLGSATHSFELMLSAFILGIALGAWWTRSRADRFARPLEALGVAQWVMGALALATLPLYATSFPWMAGLVTTLRRAPHGYEIFSLARYGICLAVMFPATFCAGITLPLITRLLMTAGAGEKAIGTVYGANTLGSILGAALAGLALLPWLGLERLLGAGAALDIALGIALFAVAGGAPRGSRRLAPAAAGIAVLFIAAILGWVRLDRLTLVSGVYRTGELLDPRDTRVVFYHDGRTATVSVRRQTNGDLTVSTNGKPDASLTAGWLAPDMARPPAPLEDDDSTQLLLGVVSLAHAPDATRAAVIGQGSGMTSHVLLGSPRLQRLVTIEIEPEMIHASHAFQPANRRVFEDPRSRFAIDDARSYLAATHERFDLIVSEPSNPWVSGVSGLFTHEFYRRIRTALADGGVLGQWLHLYSLDDDLALSVLAAIHRNFRAYRIYLVSSTDMLILASNRPDGLAPDWGVIGAPGIAADLRHTHPFTPATFEALRVTDRDALAPLLERWPANSDFFPILDLGAERSRFENRIADGLLHLHEDRFGMSALNAPHVEPPPTDLLALPAVPRVRGLMWIARLRAALGGEPPHLSDTPAFTARLQEGLERQLAIRASCSSDLPPPDWRLWLLEVLRGENERHSGTSGYADEQFFRPLLRYAERSHAPAPVARTLEWLYALDRRDFDLAARETDLLAAEAIRVTPLVPPALVLDGGTMAKLGVGDVEGARRILAALRPLVGRPPSDLRMRLLGARLEARPSGAGGRRGLAVSMPAPCARTPAAGRPACCWHSRSRSCRHVPAPRRSTSSRWAIRSRTNCASSTSAATARSRVWA